MQFDVFISHASEDKANVARPLAEALKALGLRVWLDELELTIGDSLRRSIDAGLADSRFGVVILSHNFFRKEWPQKELDYLVAREDGKEKVILPVWHNLTREDVVKYSPILADKLAASTTEGIEGVATQIQRATLRGKKHKSVQPNPNTPDTKEPQRSERVTTIEITVSIVITMPEPLVNTQSTFNISADGNLETLKDQVVMWFHNEIPKMWNDSKMPSCHFWHNGQFLPYENKRLTELFPQADRVALEFRQDYYQISLPGKKPDVYSIDPQIPIVDILYFYLGQSGAVGCYDLRDQRGRCLPKDQSLWELGILPSYEGIQTSIPKLAIRLKPTFWAKRAALLTGAIVVGTGFGILLRWLQL